MSLHALKSGSCIMPDISDAEDKSTHSLV